MKRWDSMKTTFCCFIAAAVLSWGCACADGNQVYAGEQSSDVLAEASADSSARELTGAKTQDELVEVIAEAINSDDYSKLNRYIDKTAQIASLMFTGDVISGEEATLEKAREIILKMQDGAEAFSSEYPEIARGFEVNFNVKDPAEYIENYMNFLSNAFSEGAINEDNPDYETLRQILCDRDKGTDYITENYPEILDNWRQNGIHFSLQELFDDLLLSDADKWYSGVFSEFKGAEIAFRPEDICDTGDGLYSVYLARVDMPDYPVALHMEYYYSDGGYYLARLSKVM